jgi:intracellular septation protein
MAEKQAASPMVRLLIDYGPLAVFFGVNALAHGPVLARIFAATTAFMVAMAAAIALSWWKTRHVSPMLWITAAFVLVFGSLTLYFHDQTFIQIKPTIIYAMFAIVLGYGLIAGKPLLQMVLEQAYPGLSAKGWRLLTINWAVFFAVAAVANEAVRHFVTWDQWVVFKTWVMIPATLVFAGLNIPMLLRHGLQLDGPQEVPIPPQE